MTGDGKLDLVLTQSCSDGSVGTTHWLVYAGSGSGFAATGASFALPSTGGPLPAIDGTQSPCSQGGTGYVQSWATVDMTGDGKPDLVVTLSCTDTTVGTSHWLLYANSGSAFATTAASFTLPSTGGPLSVLDGSQSSCAQGGTGFVQSWGVVDVTGDRRPDLLVTLSCTDTTVGTAHWLVYANSGSGFATSSSSFTLPSTGGPLSSIDGAQSSCAQGGTGFEQSWSLADLQGDGKLDLVLTKSCTDSSVGTTSWSVYTGVCKP
jgi:hypothetical protein